MHNKTTIEKIKILTTTITTHTKKNGIQWSWVQIPLRPTFYSYFKESFSGEYNVYQFIPLHPCDYVKKKSIKTNVATDEGNG